MANKPMSHMSIPCAPVEDSPSRRCWAPSRVSSSRSQYVPAGSAYMGWDTLACEPDFPEMAPPIWRSRPDAVVDWALAPVDTASASAPAKTAPFFIQPLVPLDGLATNLRRA